jgi:hypothetical protein
VVPAVLWSPRLVGSQYGAALPLAAVQVRRLQVLLEHLDKVHLQLLEMGRGAVSEEVHSNLDALLGSNLRLQQVGLSPHDAVRMSRVCCQGDLMAQRKALRICPKKPCLWVLVVVEAQLRSSLERWRPWQVAGRGGQGGVLQAHKGAWLTSEKLLLRHINDMISSQTAVQGSEDNIAEAVQWC